MRSDTTVAVDVCIIDDDEGVRRVIAKMLHTAGFVTSEAASGATGVQCVAATRARVAVVDLFMPARNGFEAIEELHTRFTKLRVLAISEKGDADYDDLLNHAQRLGAKDFLAKPFNSGELIAKVAELMRVPDATAQRLARAARPA